MYMYIFMSFQNFLEQKTYKQCMRIIIMYAHFPTCECRILNSLRMQHENVPVYQYM